MLYVRPILLTVCNQLNEITTTSVVCNVYTILKVLTIYRLQLER